MGKKYFNFILKIKRKQQQQQQQKKKSHNTCNNRFTNKKLFKKYKIEEVFSKNSSDLQLQGEP